MSSNVLPCHHLRLMTDHSVLIVKRKKEKILSMRGKKKAVVKRKKKKESYWFGLVWFYGISTVC